MAASSSILQSFLQSHRKVKAALVVLILRVHLAMTDLWSSPGELRHYLDLQLVGRIGGR